MSLSIGQHVTAEALHQPLTVTQKLGEGGQGTVYLVDGPQGPQALKWYNAAWATAEQHQAIRELAQAGPPRGPAGRRFIWPLSLVTAANTALFDTVARLLRSG